MTMGIVLTTSGQMEIVVHDDAAAMARLFKLPVAKRLGALAEMRGISEFDEPAMKQLRQIHEQGDGEYQQSVLPGIHHAEMVDVVLTLGNPDDPIFMERTLGYYGMGSIPGSIWMVAWPTDYNASRIGACGVHELAHNIRTPNVAGPFDLEEWVIHEGLAEVFTVEVCGPDSTGAWYAPVTGKALDATWEKVTKAFGSGRSFPDWTPYVLGDEVAGRMGLRPVGVPHMGGYAVGRAIVERYLAATGLKAAQAIVRPTGEILLGIQGT